MSNAITDKTILDMIEEGRNNFVSSRFDDAAKLFGSAVRNLERKEYNIDAIYFSYARIVALDKADKVEQEITALMDLGNKCMRLALNRAMEKQKEVTHPLEKSVYMNHSQRIMKEIGMSEERESIVLSLVQLYKSLILDKNTTSDVREMFQTRIIEFCVDYDHPNLNQEYEKIKYAQLIITNADDLLNSEKFHVDVKAANKYIEAASIYLAYKMHKEVKNLLRKALKCSKHGQFDKFGFAQINRPPRATDENGKEIDPDPDMKDKKIDDYMDLLLQNLELK